jgi:hypothetical protein
MCSSHSKSKDKRFINIVVLDRHKKRKHKKDKHIKNKIKINIKNIYSSKTIQTEKFNIPFHKLPQQIKIDTLFYQSGSSNFGELLVLDKCMIELVL